MSIPKAEADLVIWLNNFSQAFATHGPALGFSDAEVAAVEADAAMLAYLVSDLIPALKSSLDANYSYKNLIKNGPAGAAGGGPPSTHAPGAAPATVAPGILPRIRQLVQRIRNTPGYTEVVGRNLGITGVDAGETPDTTLVKPTARAIALPGSQVRIEFNKRGFDGVYIESRRKGDTAWTPLGIDLYSPFMDTRAPAQADAPEAREYRLRYYDNDAPTGEWSDIITAITTP
jgi:hypothetical protein